MLDSLIGGIKKEIFGGHRKNPPLRSVSAFGPCSSFLIRGGGGGPRKWPLSAAVCGRGFLDLFPFPLSSLGIIFCRQR
jgi:hypothetical protein